MCIARGNCRVALSGVVRAVAANGVDRCLARDLFEQFGQHIGISHILMRHQSRAYLAGLRVHRQMHLALVRRFE
ncbi:hypothetical protein FQZ97_1077490 [compost metagenome]